MRVYISSFLAILLGCTPGMEPTDLPAHRALSVAQAAGPNFLLLLTDDQTYTAVHALGNELLRTPHMDRLVKEGTTFSHAFNMGGWQPAVCAASRAMLVSGRDLWDVSEYRQRWIAGDSTALNQTWPRILSRAGYRTYFTGKWHVDAPAEVVFDTVAHVRPGMPRDHWDFPRMVQRFREEVATGRVTASEIMPRGYDRPREGEPDTWSPTDTLEGGFWEGGKHWSEVTAEDAVNFIGQATTTEQPFFVYAAFNAPHDPRQAPAAYQAMYPPDGIPVWENMLPRYPEDEAVGAAVDLRDEALGPYPRTPYAVRTHLSEYYALITHLDDQIGRILDALDASGRADNTYVFLTSDHGLAVGRHGFMGKQNMYDHSIRVPLVVRGPGVPAGAVDDDLVYLQSIMPTSLRLAGIEVPDDVDFAPLDWNGEGGNKHIYTAYTDRQRALRTDRYKLIYYPTIGRRKLFDLVTDPQETNDLSTTPRGMETMELLWRKLKNEMQARGDTLILKH